MHPDHGKGLTFSEALEQLKDGRKVYRAQWAEGKNPKDQWVVMQTGHPAGIELNHNTAQRTGLPEGSIQVFEPYYMMFTPWGSFVQWTPNAADLNADDWAIYYMPGEYERLCQEETDAVLADPELVAELEADGADPRTFSHEEVKMVVALRALEREDLPDRENIRFRLLRQLMRPVSREPYSDADASMAGTFLTFVSIITGLNRDLTQTRLILDAAHAKIDTMEARDRAWGDKYPAPDGMLSNDDLHAYHRIRYFQDGWKTSPGFTQATWRLITVLLEPMLEEWRQALGPLVEADGWAVKLNGLRVADVDTIGSMSIEIVDTPTAADTAAFFKGLDDTLDPEATQHLVRPGDPGYPQRRPHRLSDQFPLHATFDNGPTPRQIRRAAPDTEATQVAKYFLTLPGCDEVEATREQWVNAERHAGFRPNGEDVGQPATAGWSSSRTNASGRIEYHPQ